MAFEEEYRRLFNLSILVSKSLRTQREKDGLVNDVIDIFAKEHLV